MLLLSLPVLMIAGCSCFYTLPLILLLVTPWSACSFVLSPDMPEVWWYQGPDGNSNRPLASSGAGGDSETRETSAQPRYGTTSPFSPVAAAPMPTIVPEPKGGSSHQDIHT
jgi:hypothetical protein